MIWIGIIIGFIIGCVWMKLMLETKLRVSYGVPFEVMDSPEASENAQYLADFLKKRFDLTSKAMSSEDTYYAWLNAYGKEMVGELTGPQDADGSYGDWWLANFVTLVDLCGCRLVLEEKGPLKD